MMDIKPPKSRPSAPAQPKPPVAPTPPPVAMPELESIAVSDKFDDLAKPPKPRGRAGKWVLRILILLILAGLVATAAWYYGYF